MEQLIKDILTFIECQDTASLMIGISGHGASGKTTLTHRIREQTGDTDYNYLCTNPYIIDGQFRRDMEAVYEYNGSTRRYKPTACLPAAHELSSLVRDVTVLKCGGEINTIDKKWMRSEKMSGSKRVTVVEGMSVAFIDPGLFDLSVFIYTDSDTELSRCLKRDVNERGGTSEMLNQSHHERRIQYEVFMHPKRHKFDIVVNNSNNMFTIEKTCLKRGDA